MGRVAQRWRKRREQLVAEIACALRECQPALRIVQTETEIVVRGGFVLTGSEGPFDQFQVAIWVYGEFPEQEPWIF